MKNYRTALITASVITLLSLSACRQPGVEDETKAPAVSRGEVIDGAAKQTALDDAKRVRTISTRQAVMNEVAVYPSMPSPMPSVHRLSMPAPLYINRNRENYLALDENAILSVIDQSVSTFSVDVDTAAYSNIRRMLVREGRLPPVDAVKLEEMINYFNYQYDVPETINQPFSVQVEMAAAPWNKNKLLLQIGLKGFEPALEKRPAANLVFLVDVSGSMQSPNKLGLVKASLRMLVNQMGKEDRVALVVYAGAAGVVLESTGGDHKSKIIRAIENLQAGGSTNGGAGIHLAYQIAADNLIERGINRVIIASDGDMNVGITDMDQLKQMIKGKRDSGIALTTLGYGAGNYNYALMEQLADVGDGNAAYIDSLLEARKVLVEEMQGTLLTIAKDVKIQVEFNPAVVAEYRLLGYENRMLSREDFTNDKVDAGEIGAGHTVTALYEIALVDSADLSLQPKRYGDFGQKSKPASAEFADEIAYVRLRYKSPEASKSIELSQPVLRPLDDATMLDASTNLRLASAVAGFGQLLRGGKYLGDWNYQDAAQLVRSAKGDDPHGYRAELVSLVELASSLSSPQGS